jgi:predicted  nucleic acid-binding Zn-ribbon protein
VDRLSFSAHTGPVLMSDPSMAEVTNGELMRAIQDLRVDVKGVETQVDALRSDLNRVAKDVAVHEAQDVSKFEAAKERMDRHEDKHLEASKEAHDKEVQQTAEAGNRALRGQLIVMGLTFGVALLSFVAGITLH